MFSDRTTTKYKIKGQTVEKVFPSGYYVVRIKGEPLMADTIRGLRQLAQNPTKTA